MLERIWKKILRRRGLSIWSIPASLLWMVSLVYRLLFAVTRTVTKPTVKTSVPVICIGNITVGGTGKTTIVEFLSQFLLRERVRVGIVSSGYGRVSDTSFVKPGYQVQRMNAADTGDEVLLLANLVPEAVFSVHRSKAEAAARLARSGDVDLIIVDDGFQHFRLERDLDIVTFDAAMKSSLLRTFPYGVLREPMKALSRADILIITRSNFAKDLGQLKGELRTYAANSEIYTAQFLATQLIGPDRRLPVKYLEDKSVFLFAGIGNHGPLRKQVSALCADLDYDLELSDHQQYDSTLISRIKSLADRYDSDIILTTGKDWVKLPAFAFGRETYYLTQSVDLDPGEERLVRYVLHKLGMERPGN